MVTSSLPRFLISNCLLSLALNPMKLFLPGSMIATSGTQPGTSMVSNKLNPCSQFSRTKFDLQLEQASKESISPMTDFGTAKGSVSGKIAHYVISDHDKDIVLHAVHDIPILAPVTTSADIDNSEPTLPADNINFLKDYTSPTTYVSQLVSSGKSSVMSTATALLATLPPMDSAIPDIVAQDHSRSIINVKAQLLKLERLLHESSNESKVTFTCCRSNDNQSDSISNDAKSVRASPTAMHAPLLTEADIDKAFHSAPVAEQPHILMVNEIPFGETYKYEVNKNFACAPVQIDQKNGKDREIRMAPYNYGYIPQTYSSPDSLFEVANAEPVPGDGDPLDSIDITPLVIRIYVELYGPEKVPEWLLTTYTPAPIAQVLRVEPIEAIPYVDDGCMDYKLVCLDPSVLNLQLFLAQNLDIYIKAIDIIVQYLESYKGSSSGKVTSATAESSVWNVLHQHAHAYVQIQHALT